MIGCPVCDTEESIVVDTRKLPGSVRRRRRCRKCGERWTTYEINAAQVVLYDTLIRAIMDDLVTRLDRLRAELFGAAQPPHSESEEWTATTSAPPPA